MLDAPRHLGGHAPRKGHQQDAPWIGAVQYEVRDAMRQRPGFAGAGAGDDQQRPACAVRRGCRNAVRGRRSLRGVELREVRRQFQLGHVHQISFNSSSFRPLSRNPGDCTFWISAYATMTEKPEALSKITI